MKVELTKLPNGLRIVTSRMPAARSVSVSLMVGVGSRYEDFKINGGVSHFLEHLLFKGSKHWPSMQVIGEAVDGVGGHHNAYTTKDYTNFYIKVPKRHAKLSLDILADMVQFPLLNDTDIDRERTVVLEEMNVWRDDPAGAIYDLLPEVLWPHDPLAQEMIGSESVISGIPREDIFAYQQLYYGPENMVVSVAGDVDHEEIVAHVKNLMGRMKRRHTPKLPPVDARLTHQRVVERTQVTNQMHILLGCQAPSMQHKQYAAMHMISALLGSGMSSRLYLELRENQGLAYSVFTDYNTFVDTGAFSVYAGVSPDNIARAMQVIVQELATLRTELVSETELQKIKHKMAGGMQLALESTSAIADRVGSRLVLLGDLKTPDETIAELEAVTAEEIQAVAQQYLTTDALRLAVIAAEPNLAKQAFEQEVENKQ